MSSEWSMLEQEWQLPYHPQPPRPTAPYSAASNRCAPSDTYQYYSEATSLLSPYYNVPAPQPPMPAPQPPMPPPPTSLTMSPPDVTIPQYAPQTSPTVSAFPRGENPREIRNKAEKQRRDKLNHSIAELAGLVPPVIASSRRVDKTGVLRLTAHYLRAHQYVFGDAIAQGHPGIKKALTPAVLQIMNGFLLTTTYKGLVVVVSQNVQEYLGFSELDLLGQNIMTIVHEDDRSMLKEQLMPRKTPLGPNGELLIPDEPDAKTKINDLLASEKRNFVIRLKKLTQRSEPAQYVTCAVEGSLRKADRASRGYTRCCQMVRRARARADNPCSSGNDVVFIGMVRPKSETFITERQIEAYRLEYRTRHSVDGEIIQCEQKISLVTGYMVQEVFGLNAMNFMHRDDVRWVIIALREMYDQQRLIGESCYRLMTKNGQFVYMRTRGSLEVDESSRDVTTFICTNTVVNETDGRDLINQMKKKFMLLVNNNESPPEIQDDPTEKTKENGEVPIEDPGQLEKVILHLVTNLPSPDPPTGPSNDPGGASASTHINIIPPRKERILSCIGKFYDVIKIFDVGHSTRNNDHSDLPSGKGSSSNTSAFMQDINSCEALDSESCHPKAHELSAKDVPPLETFEDDFMDRDSYAVDDSELFKISDQVLGAVQLKEDDPSTSGLGYKRQACDQDVEENGFAHKRKVCGFAETEFAQLQEQENVATFEASNIDSLFDDSGLDGALNMIQSIGDTETNPADVFPDILSESDFQDLFGDIEANHQDETAVYHTSP